MSWMRRGWTLLGVIFLALPVVVLVEGPERVLAQSGIATTTVADTVYRADGTAAAGTVLVSWPGFSTGVGQTVSSGSTSVTLGAGGALSVALVPNSGAMPIGSYYTAVYHLDDGSVHKEYWVVPSSAYPVALSAIRSSVLPTAVAMQTVSKSYVDTAIASAVAGHPLISSNPYVLKAGDAMTGALGLPGDPTTPLQAADKHYVDASVSGFTTGLGQKVSTVPAATQTVIQPAGTQLSVNRLNGAEYAAQYQVQGDGRGIANAVASADCVGGCEVKVDRSYTAPETYAPQSWNSSAMGGTHLEDTRGGERRDSYFNPFSVTSQGNDAGQQIDVTSTRSAATVYQTTGSNDPASFGLVINHQGLTGGSNIFPQDVGAAFPYFKSNYSALAVTGTYNTEGQHVLGPNAINCYGVGDCLAGSQFIVASGGFRDNADEGAHPFDIQVHEDSRVFQGSCSAGCSPGSTTVTVQASAGGGTQGEGRFLIDKNPANVLTAGLLTGSTGGEPGAGATFSGTNFPVSVFMQAAQLIPAQANKMAPGTVTIAILTSGVPAGFVTGTGALPQTSGVACVVDQPSAGAHNYEMANYLVVDGTHLQLTLNKPHVNGTTIAVGGLCGYGLEQTVDTQNGIRQVFPVIGSFSATGLYYAGGHTPIVGIQGQASGFLNVNASVTSIARNNNTVTLTTAGNLPVDVNGLTLTVAGVTDPSYNGSFAVTTTGPNTLTYASSGVNSTSSGGTVSMLTGGYALYPMAEVLGVFDASTKGVDGQMTLAANTVSWAANDALEEPHYYEEKVSADMQYVGQTTPRPSLTQSAGIQYEMNVGPGIHGWTIANAAPASSYLGNGGTHTFPEVAFESTGVWHRAMSVQAGEEAAFTVNCNSHGCGRWDSAYNLFELSANGSLDTVNFQPLTSAMTFTLRGTSYGFTPQAFTAGTIDATTIDATTINATTVNAGQVNGPVAAASLPVFQASGSVHAQGAVPDPGAVAGTTRYLREDGAWVVPVASGVLPGPQGIPQRASLLGEYLLNEGTGTVAHDTSGLGNDGTISGANWEGTADLNFGANGQYVQLPVALNQTNTFVFAIYDPPYGSGVSPQAPGYGFHNSFSSYPSLLCGTDTGHTCMVANSFYVGVAQRFDLFYNSTGNTEASQALPTGWHVVAIVNGVAPATDKIYYDGVEVNGYAKQVSGGILHPATGNYQIGGGPLYGGSWWLGKVAATWAWSTALGANDVAAATKSAMDYIRAKGVATGPISPKMHANPVVLGGLDSRTRGYLLSSPSKSWINNLTLTDASYTTVNMGNDGSSSYDLAAMFDSMYTPYMNAGSGQTVVVLWGFVNDGTAADDAGVGFTTTIPNALKSMVQRTKAAGGRVVLATEISNNLLGDANRDTVNATLRAQAYGWGVDNLVDLATIPALGTDGADANTTYFNGDKIHPTDAGDALIASVMSNAVNELLGSTETTHHATAAVTYQELAGDRYLDLTGTAAQTVSLPDCSGYTLPRYVVNLGTAASTVAPVNSEALTGSGAVAVGSRAGFVTVPGASNAGGCSWKRML